MPVIENCRFEVSGLLPGHDWHLPNSDSYSVIYQDGNVRILRLFGQGGEKIQDVVRVDIYRDPPA